MKKQVGIKVDVRGVRAGVIRLCWLLYEKNIISSPEMGTVFDLMNDPPPVHTKTKNKE